MLTYTINKKFNETFTIGFIGTPDKIENNGTKYTTEILHNIKSINNFSDETQNETDTIYFKKYFKYKNFDNWSDLIPIEELSALTFDSCVDLQLELYYYRTIDNQNNITTALYIDNIIISGIYELSEFDSEAVLKNTNDTVLLTPKDVYKIFRIDNFQVISNHNNYNIKYHFTQDNGRTFTPWEDLTKENISTVKLSPIRFAMVEYSITNLGNPLIINDIILSGDFQNVSANYMKLNRYGLKEDCITGIIKDSNGNIISDNSNTSNNMNFYSQCGLSTYNTIQNLKNDNELNTNDLFKPYQTKQLSELANLLSNQVNDILGHEIDYYLTDPDINGTDVYVHEYTLKNITDYQKIKVIAPDNKFPSETLIVNQFSLDFFDTFEIQIMKDTFHNAFGIDKRPSQDDILYICETNMLYYVKHAQAFRNVMNTSTYYKVILEKYEYKTNIGSQLEEATEMIKELTDNTTLDSLFSQDMKEEEDKIANKTQTYPTTFDKRRAKVYTGVEIIKDKLNIDYNLIFKSYYDLSNKKLKYKDAIEYKAIDQILNKGDNRSFMFWIKFKNQYSPNKAIISKVIKSYNIIDKEIILLNNYKDDTGYVISYLNNGINFKINNIVYRTETELLTNVWYAVLINMEQRQNKLNVEIYKRNSDTFRVLFDLNTYVKQTVNVNDTAKLEHLLNNNYTLVDNEEVDKSTDLMLITEKEFNFEPVEYDTDNLLTIKGNDIYLTNIRILNDIANKENLKEFILKDEQNIILSDNALKTLISTNYLNKNWK